MDIDWSILSKHFILISDSHLCEKPLIYPLEKNFAILPRLIYTTGSVLYSTFMHLNLHPLKYSPLNRIVLQIILILLNLIFSTL